MKEGVNGMTATHWQKLKEILADALECSSESERQQIVERGCHSDEILVAEVDSFLRYAAEVADEDWPMRYFPKVGAEWSSKTERLTKSIFPGEE